jgi:hypothetical protein
MSLRKLHPSEASELYRLLLRYLQYDYEGTSATAQELNDLMDTYGDYLGDVDDYGPSEEGQKLIDDPARMTRTIREMLDLLVQSNTVKRTANGRYSAARPRRRY